MSGIGTKNVSTGGAGIPKSFGPGNHKVKINAIKLSRPGYAKPNEVMYHVELDLETEPIGGDFEGFFLDKDNEAKGRNLGQTARVKTNQWAHKDSEWNGKKFSMVDAIVRDVKSICEEVGSDWCDKTDGKYQTIEEFVEAFNTDAPFKDVFLNFCVGGQQVVKENGHPGFYLHLPKYERGFKNFTHPDRSEHLLKYDKVLHLEVKGAPAAVGTFSAGTGEAPLMPVAGAPAVAEELPWEMDDDEDPEKMFEA